MTDKKKKIEIEEMHCRCPTGLREKEEGNFGVTVCRPQVELPVDYTPTVAFSAIRSRVAWGYGNGDRRRPYAPLGAGRTLAFSCADRSPSALSAGSWGAHRWQCN